MKKYVVQCLMVIFCLVETFAYSRNSLVLKVDFLKFDYSIQLPMGSQDTLINASHRMQTITKTAVSNNADKKVEGSNTMMRDVSGKSVTKDWTRAPNSYIFDPSQNSEGLYLPVKKAYVMWEKEKILRGNGIPVGKATADVLWEDVHGLIKSGPDYSLEVVDSGENSKIKIPINKAEEGNAVVVYRVNGEIFWSWHIWVTDNPANGSNYKSFAGVKRERNDGTVELIPDSEWGWMDRNLGAVSNSITGTEWIRNGGLLYQWGRKDPIPPLVYKGNDFYEVSGSIGRVRHRGAKNFINATSIDNLRKFVLLSDATVENNIRLSVKNPLSLIYVNKDDNSGPAYYNNNANLMVNWFGKSSGISDSKLSELNLWSDNSKGKVGINYNNDNSSSPYRDKSAYDPCPNGWRIPSMLVANLASQSYVDDIRVDFSPFGVRTAMGKNTFETNSYHIIKPIDTNVPNFMKGFKVYTNVGFDLSNVDGYNMGVFPGTGQLVLNLHAGQYTDQHHVSLWTATMVRHFDASPAVGARALFLLGDKDQPDIPDPNFPNVKGRYRYQPLSTGQTSNAAGCRCIKDPLYIVNDYDFPTEYLYPTVEYREGIDNPNTYQIVKNTISSNIEIPISKAFSVQSQLLNNPDILNPSNFNNLKANILWTTNNNLINTISISNGSPASLADISNSKILVQIMPDQSGNAVVTLHNNSITNPIYWSWHIWVTDTAISSYTYTTEIPNSGAVNYVNYVNNADNVFQTEFMDRNIGATDAFPIVATPLTPTAAELAKIRASTGMHYQWGRKDPIPTFQYADNKASYNVFLGTVMDNGTLNYSILTAADYNSLSGSYLIPYTVYANSSNANVLSTDKPADIVSKVLSYSVRNPLVYMIPSTFSPYNNTTPNYTNGTDWLAKEPNLAPDRWGRGGRKSPFDPCPAGWRIPDVSGVAIEANKDYGLTPWYKKDKKVATSYSLISDYSGVRVRNPSTTSTIGYTFNDPGYYIGNYPDAGSRGFRSVTANQTAAGTYNFINFQYPGVWTGALLSNYIGRPINVIFDAASTANRIIAFHDNNDPYFGMSCRCVKMKFDANGNEEGVISKLPVVATATVKATNIFNKVEIETKVKDQQLILFPNPVKDIIYVNVSGDKEYYYQIYNISGQLVKSGKFVNGQTDVSSLVAGGYLVRINNSEGLVKIIKQ